jgi:hypothetical protein
LTIVAPRRRDSARIPNDPRQLLESASVHDRRDSLWSVRAVSMTRSTKSANSARRRLVGWAGEGVADQAVPAGSVDIQREFPRPA